MARRPIDQLIRHLSALSEDAAIRPGPCQTITEAALRGDVALLAAFLAGGANIDQRSIGFASPLDAAASAGHLAAVEFLMARGASLTRPDALFPILHFPSTNRRLEVIERLLQAGVPHEPHRPLLRLMARNKHWDVVDAMVAGGMDIAWLSAGEQAAFTAWRQQEGPRDTAWLAARRARETQKQAAVRQRALGKRRLSDAEREEHETAAIALVEKHGRDLAQARLQSGTSVLAQAIAVDAQRLAAALIAAGAPLNSSDPINAPLAKAAERGAVESMKMLLDAGAEANGAAVIAAARAGSLAGLELLLERGARPLAKERNAALSMACGPDEKKLRERLEALSARKKRAT
jgi:ankyrin repeat protein